MLLAFGTATAQDIWIGGVNHSGPTAFSVCDQFCSSIGQPSPSVTNSGPVTVSFQCGPYLCSASLSSCGSASPGSSQYEAICNPPPPPDDCEDDQETYVGAGSAGDNQCVNMCEKNCQVSMGGGDCLFFPTTHQCFIDGPLPSDCPQDYGDCPHPDDHDGDDNYLPPPDPDGDPDPDEEDYCERFPQSAECTDDNDDDDDADSDSSDSLGDDSTGDNNSNDGDQFNDGQDDQGLSCSDPNSNCEGKAANCNERPTCNASAIECAHLNQEWYSRCGGEHSDLGDCSQQLECSGDPLLCAQVRYDHVAYCDIQLSDSQRDDPNNLANVIQGIDGGGAYRGGPNVDGSEVDLSAISTDFNQSGFGLNRACIDDYEVTTPLADFNIPLSEWCSFLQLAGYIVLIAGVLIGIRIVGEAF